MFLVGLPDNAVKESEQRVRSAFENSAFKMTARKCVVNLAPADLRKEGSGFDLPIAVAILAATEQLVAEPLEEAVFVGELSLDGSIRGVKGVLSVAAEARAQGFRKIYVPHENAAEAAVVEGIEVYAVGSLVEVAAVLSGEQELQPVQGEVLAEESVAEYEDDFADVKGQAFVKRAMEIAAAGGHNVIMIGPPGSGKTMLARRMPSILPPMSREEALETTKIHSVAGKLGTQRGLMSCRPFRAPHHLASPVALIGGGQNPQPGEVSLAHNGVLFLDELPEFGHGVLEVLRQPLEEGQVCISRATGSETYPSRFMLVCAMNPCRCGYYGHPTKKCSCRADDIKKYMSRISGPLLDRIDIQIEVSSLTFDELSCAEAGESSAVIRERVNAARGLAVKRFKEGGEGIFANADMSSSQIRRYAKVDEAGMSLLRAAYDSMGLSARGHDRILRVARTIADLAGEETISAVHMAEAIRMRTLDRKYW